MCFCANAFVLFRAPQQSVCHWGQAQANFPPPPETNALGNKDNQYTLGLSADSCCY